jgi:hypothetical protein
MKTISCCGTWLQKPWGKLAIVVAGGLFVYLAIFHWYYVATYWPLLIFLACPLSHLFMHHRHSGSHGCCGGSKAGNHEPSTEPTKVADEKP